MSLDSLLATAQLPPIPNDDVEFDVGGDVSACSAAVQAEFASLGGRLSVRISTLVTRAALHFAGGVTTLGGLSIPGTQIALAWQNLCHLQPRQVVRSATKKRPQKRCLVVNEFPNSRFQAVLTEYLGAAAGLSAAIRLFGVPYRRWTAPSGLPPYDFTAPQTTTGPIRLETRGRFNRALWSQAKNQLKKKRTAAQAQGGFSAFCGTIFAPRTSTRGRAEDLWIDDPTLPDGGGVPETAEQLVHRHYGLLLSAVGATQLGGLLVRAASTEDAMAEFSRTGRADGLRLLRQAPVIDVAGTELIGTARDKVPWWGDPRSDGEIRVGVAWQIASDLLEHGLRADDRGSPEASVDWEGRRLVALDDGAVLLWSPRTRS